MSVTYARTEEPAVGPPPSSGPPDRRRRLLVLSQHYTPEPNFITESVAQHASSQFDVVVVTAHPNYPLGRFYPGAKCWRPVKTMERGVAVWRVPMLPYHGNSKLLRAVSYLSYALAAGLWSILVAGRVDVVWVYQGPFTAALAAIWFKWVQRANVVITCADLWPESFLAAGVTKPGALMRVLFAYSRLTNRVADDIVCATRGTIRRFTGDGVSPSRLHFVPVWVDGIGAAVTGDDTREVPSIVYAGNLGPAQGLETVIRAAALLEREGVRVAFDIYGSGSQEEALCQLAAELGTRSVTFHGRAPVEVAFSVSASAFAQLVILRPSPLFRMTIPSKLFFCFAAAAPLLYGLEGEAAELAGRCDGGIAFDARDPASLVKAIYALLDRPASERREMRRRLRQYYEDNFTRSLLLSRYMDIFGKYVGASPSPASASATLAQR